jgi:hypothetical protein
MGLSLSPDRPSLTPERTMKGVHGSNHEPFELVISSDSLSDAWANQLEHPESRLTIMNPFMVPP